MSQTTDSFAPTIRKEILNALDKHIIPALDAHKVLQLLAEPPFDLSTVEYEVERDEPLPDKDHNPLQVLRRWEKEHILAVRMPTFGFVYEGVSFERIGVTQSVADEVTEQGYPQPKGITLLQIPAPGIICYPAGTPHSDGTPTPNVRLEGRSVLAVKLMSESVFVFLCGDINTHSLEISDQSLLRVGLLYFEELRAAENQRGAQGLLLAFMCRLRRYLHNNRPSVGNTSWVEQRDLAIASSSPTELRHYQLCWNAMDYIQTHLHTALSLRTIAAHVGISGFYLNRLFMNQQGTTVMRYVTQMRVEAAKGILRENPERVSDVAKLVGFASVSSFSAIFRKSTGLSPSDFRRQQQS